MNPTRPSTGPTLRRLLLGVAIVALCSAACGSSDSGSSDSDATPTTTTPSADGTVTTAPLDPAKFDETIATLDTELDHAGTDLCTVVGILERAGAAGNPTSADQAKVAAHFLANAYTKVADAAPASMSADADVIRASAATIGTEADEPDFDASTFMAKGPAAFSDERFLKAMTNLSAEIKKCSPTTGEG